MLIDDSLFVAITSVIKHSNICRIDKIYINSNFPNLTARQDLLSLDNYFQSVYYYERI